MKRIVLVILLLALTACASNNYAFNKNVYEKGEKAYIVIGAINNTSPRDYRVYNVFYFKTDKGKSIKLWVDGHHSFMIPPGTYTLQKLQLYGQRGYGNLISKVDIDLHSVQGTFTVAPGEAVYLGQIDTVVSKIHKSLIKRLFNMKTSESDLTYTSTVKDAFEQLDKAKYEADIGHSLTSNLMKWGKVSDTDN